MTEENLDINKETDENTNIDNNFVIFTKDEILENCSLEDIQKTTEPPPRYSEASLVKELKVRDIGRPSTFSSIVDTVTSSIRGYSTIEDKKIIPTDKGMQLSSFLDRAFPNLINLNYTKEMEKELDEIADGKITSLEFLTKFYNNLESAIKNNTETTDIVQVQVEKKICPKCGAPMIIKRSHFGKLFYGCSRYPDCNGLRNAE